MPGVISRINSKSRQKNAALYVNGACGYRAETLSPNIKPPGMGGAFDVQLQQPAQLHRITHALIASCRLCYPAFPLAHSLEYLLVTRWCFTSNFKFAAQRATVLS